MAVSNNWQQTSATAVASLTIANYVVGAGSNKILVVVTGASDLNGAQNGVLPTSVTWSGVALTLITSAANVLEFGYAQGATLWGLVNPTTGTGNIVVTWPEAQSVAAQMAACYLIDREQVLPTTLTSTMNSAADTGTTKWTLTVAGVPTGAYVVDCCSSSQTGGTHSATEAGQVQKVNLLTASSFLLSSEREVAATADVTFGWVASGSSGRRGMVMAAFKAAATGGGGPSHRRVLWAPNGAPQVDVAGSYTAMDAIGTAIAATGTHYLGVQPIYIIGDVVVTMSPGQELLLADNNSDFSLVQGQAGWTYQWLIGTTYTNATVDSVNNKWIKPGNAYWQINAIHQQGVIDADLTTKIYAVRKWTVPSAVTRVRISGTWTRGDVLGDGSDVQIIHWSGATTELRFRRVALLGAIATINQVFIVASGDVIEFRAGIGPALDGGYDDTTLQVLIYSTTAAVNAADDDQAPLTNPGDPDLSDAINAGLALFVGGAPAGSQEAGTERISRNTLAFINGDATRSDPDMSGWVVPETSGVNGDAYFTRPATWNNDVGTRFALWMDVVIDVVDQWSSLFSIPWQDVWAAPYAALSFGRSGTTTSAVMSFTPATGVQVSVTGPANSWSSVLGRHKIGFVRDGNLVYFFLDGAQVGSAVAGAGTSAPGWAAAFQPGKPISLLGRSETAATSQGVDGAVVQLRFWAIPTGTTAAQMIARMVTLQTAPNTGRFVGAVRTRLPLGTIENMNFGQCPSDNEFFDPTVVDMIQAAPQLQVYGIRHNLKMRVAAKAGGTIVMNVGGVATPSSFAGPWSYTTGGYLANGYTGQWDRMHDAGIYLLGTLFEGAVTDYYGVPIYPKTATERDYWADQAVALMLYLEAGWPGLLVAVEVENEPDGNWPVPEADLAAIAAALKAKVRAVPALNNIKIIGPAYFDSPSTKAQNLINLGFLASIDHWSHHIYAPSDRFLSYETILRGMFQGAGYPNMKVIITEYGGQGTSNCYRVLSDAVSLIRGRFNGASYFPLVDYGSFPNSGFMNTDGSVDLQGQIQATFYNRIGWGVTYVGTDTGLDANIVSVHVTKAGAHIRVMWSANEVPRTVTVTGTYTTQDYLGNVVPSTGTGLRNNDTHYLSIKPIYVFGTVTIADAAVGSQDVLLTDSKADFSTTQGQAGWTYQWMESGVYTNATVGVAGRTWANPSYPSWMVGLDVNREWYLLNPVVNSANTAPVCAVSKWVVPVATPAITRVRVRAMWSTGPGEARVNLYHWHGATSTLRYSQTLSPGNVSDFIQAFDAVAGDVIEFRADTGPTLDGMADITALQLGRIYRTDGPVTAPQDLSGP